MKKFFTLILAVILAMGACSGFIACNQNNSGETIIVKDMLGESVAVKKKS